MELTFKTIVLIVLGYSAYTDIKTKEIMTLPIYMCMLLAVLEMMIKGELTAWTFIGVIPGIVMLIVSLLSKGKVGEGDAYLVIALGLTMGMRITIISLTIGSVIAGAYSLILIITKKANMKTTIAYAPFLLSGYLGAIALA